LGFPAGRSRIGLVKGVVPMPKLPESGHRDKSGHCCIAQLFGVGASGSPGCQGTGSLPQAATALRTSRGRPASTIVRVYTPGSRLFPGTAASRNLFAQLCGFISQAAVTRKTCTIVRVFSRTLPGSCFLLRHATL
jgi:hypothetical protein